MHKYQDELKYQASAISIITIYEKFYIFHDLALREYLFCY